jgi:tetraacyldisaccharide 4'-kinase
MQEERPHLQWVVCDDAFQHRWLKPTISMLLVDATQPVSEDAMLPLGRLRDLPSRIHQADAVIVTRLEGIEVDVQEKFASNFPSDRPVFASGMQTQSLRCWPSHATCPNGDAASPPARRERILAVAGIARPERFMDRLAERFQVVRREAFADHRNFTEKDFKRWKRIVDSDRLHALVTTEKDAMRLPSDGIDGIDVRYEPLNAVWIEPDAVRTWLKQQIAAHSR